MHGKLCTRLNQLLLFWYCVFCFVSWYLVYYINVVFTYKDKLNNCVKMNVCNLKWCFIMISCLEFPLGLSRGHAHRFLLQETVEWLLSSNQIQNKSSTLLLIILMIYHVHILFMGDVIICKCNETSMKDTLRFLKLFLIDF